VFGFWKRRRRRRLLEKSFPDDWREIIQSNVAIYSLIPPNEQQRLLDAVSIIIDERPFLGVGDFEVTDEVALTIAAQAALLVLNADGYYFDRVGVILVHGTHPRVRMMHPLGGVVLVEEGVAIAGQLLEQGEVRLAWDEVLASGRDPTDGYNVVLHEFAHHLDWLDGEVQGIPPLASRSDELRWLEIFDEEAAQLRNELRAGREILLPDHASDSPAELFAYSTECFFEQPQELAEFHPELFECLLSFYKTDPRRWFDAQRE